MKVTYKPEGYTSVAPYLVVNGVDETIKFLKQVFGAKPLRTHVGPDGLFMHAEVRIDDTVVMLADSGAAATAIPAHVHVYVTDVDTTYQMAVDAGATPVQEPVKKQDADKRGGFRDAGGTTWWVSTQVE
jgi:PhnB protein